MGSPVCSGRNREGRDQAAQGIRGVQASQHRGPRRDHHGHPEHVHELHQAQRGHRHADPAGGTRGGTTGLAHEPLTSTTDPGKREA